MKVISLDLILKVKEPNMMKKKEKCMKENSRIIIMMVKETCMIKLEKSFLKVCSIMDFSQKEEANK